MDDSFVLHTPLMWLTKAQTWELTDELGGLDFIRERTLTCYNGIIADGYGEYPACQLQKRGLYEYLSLKNDSRSL